MLVYYAAVMVETLLRVAAADWDSAVRGLGVEWGDRAVVLGPDSALITESLLLADSPPLAAVGPLVAILGGDPVPGDLDRAHPAAVPLETGSVSVVIAVHAWQGRADPAGVVAEAQGWSWQEDL